MAPVQTTNGQQLLVQISDGGTPATYAHDCMINAERGIQFSSDFNQFVVPDCDNPDLPGWKEGVVDGKSATINGAGMTHTASIGMWHDWFDSGAAKSVRFKIVTPAGVSVGYWEGDFNLTAFEITGNRGEKSTFTSTMNSNGAVRWVAGP